MLGVENFQSLSELDFVLEPDLETFLNLRWQPLLEDFVALTPQLHRRKGADDDEFTETSGLVTDRKFRRQHTTPRVPQDVVSRGDIEVLEEID